MLYVFVILTFSFFWHVLFGICHFSVSAGYWLELPKKMPTLSKKCTSFTAVGVDPGLAATGIAVIEVIEGKGYTRTWDTLSTKSKEPISKRLEVLYNGIVEIFTKWNASVLIVEDVFFLPKFPKAAMQLGAVHGILNLAAALKNIEVVEMKPTEVKKALTGNGRAPKDQVERAVRRMCGITEEIKPDHASDALALAVVGLSRLGVVKW